MSGFIGTVLSRAESSFRIETKRKDKASWGQNSEPKHMVSNLGYLHYHKATLHIPNSPNHKYCASQSTLLSGSPQSSLKTHFTIRKS